MGGEVEKRVNRLESDVADLRTRMAVAESNIENVKEDLTSIKNNTTWILRLIIGAFVMALIGLLIKGGV